MFQELFRGIQGDLIKFQNLPRCFKNYLGISMGVQEILEILKKFQDNSKNLHEISKTFDQFQEPFRSF